VSDPKFSREVLCVWGGGSNFGFQVQREIKKMNRFQTGIAFFLIAVISINTPVLAKAAFKSKEQMIQTAEVIAIVEITQVKPVSVKGKHWTYAKESSAQVQKVLKGTLPAQVSLFGGEDFICAQCHFETGRHLVFLDYDQDLLTGNNWEPSIRKITNNEVEWITDDNIFSKKTSPLSEVIAEIEKTIEEQKNTAPIMKEKIFE
jgi:hypothetical protein